MCLKVHVYSLIHAQRTEGERWGMSNLDANTVFLPEIDGLSRANNIPYLPMAVPRDLHNKLKHFHGNHFAWFMGQLLKYFLRPNKDLQSFLDSKMERLRFKKPIVGYVVLHTLRACAISLLSLKFAVFMCGDLIRLGLKQIFILLKNT